MMSMIRILILCLFIGTLAWAKTEVRFERGIEVSTREKITWADLASVQGGSSDLLRELAQIPWTGSENMRATLRERRTQNDIYERLNVKFVLPQTVELKKVSGYSSAEFRRKLTNHLSALCAECRFEIRSIQDSRVHLPSEWVLDESALKLSGSLLVPVNARDMASAWIPVQLKVFRSALVLKRSLMLGQKIATDDVESRESDVSQSRETPVSMADLGSVAAARSLPAGQVLFPSDLKREEAVKRGQSVKLMMGTDDYEVSVTAVAEENGRIGDLVKVKNTDSGKILSGAVTGQGQVRLQ